MRLRFLTLALASLFVCVAAKADVIYTTSLTYGADSVSYTFDEPDFLTAYTTITPSELTSSTQTGLTLKDIQLNPTNDPSGGCYNGSGGSCLFFVFSAGNLGLATSLYDQPMTSDGTYTGSGYITTTITSTTAATPELSAFALLGTGLLGIGGLLRRRVV